MNRNALLTALIVGTLAVPGIGRAGSDAENSPLFDIPRLATITIDGDASDRKDHGFRVGPILTLDGLVRPPSDYDSRFRLAWDEKGLLFLGMVRANHIAEAKDDSQLGGGDAVELFMVAKRGDTSFLQAQLAAGADTNQPNARYFCFDYRAGRERLPAPVVEVAGKATPDGHVIEARVPWSNLSISPEMGRAPLRVDVRRIQN